MRSDCHVCRSEGLTARARVRLWNDRADIIATLYQVDSDWLAADEAAVSDLVWRRLELNPGDPIRADHAPALEVRKRMYGGRLGERSFQAIIADIVA
jgi:thymidine phosphorylase